MRTNLRVEKCTCFHCQRWQRHRTIRKTAIWGGAISGFILAIGIWTYYNSLEFQRLHLPYQIVLPG